MQSEGAAQRPATEHAPHRVCVEELVPDRVAGDLQAEPFLLTLLVRRAQGVQSFESVLRGMLLRYARGRAHSAEAKLYWSETTLYWPPVLLASSTERRLRAERCTTPRIVIPKTGGQRI